MTVVRGAFAPLLVPGARKVFVDDYNELPADYPAVFNVENSGKAFEDDLVMTGLPIAVFKPEGEEIAFDRPVFRGKVRYLHAGYGLGYEITQEAVEDDQYAALNSQGAANLARSMREAESVSAWNILNNSFNSVVTYDGVSLINAAHPGIGGLSFSNTPVAPEDLSTAALKSSSERFFNMANDRGLKISLMAKNLIVPIGNWWIAQEILGTQVVLGGPSGETASIVSNDVVNVVTMMGLSPIKSPYLTDQDAWWVTADKSQHKMNFFWRRTPQDVSGDDLRAGLAWFGITARWSTGATDWRGVDGSEGA